MKRVFNFCKKKFKHYRGKFIFFVLISLISSFLVNIMPYINGKFIDELLYSKNRRFLLNYAILVVIIVIIGFFLGYIANIFMINLQSKISFSIYKDILNHVYSISMDRLNNMNVAAMNQRVMTDINDIVTFIISISQNIISKILIIIISFYIVFLLNKLFSLLIILFGILYYITSKLLKSKIYKIKYKYKEEQNKFFAKTHEQYNYIKFVKMHGLNEVFIKRLEKPFTDLLKSTITNQKLNYLYNGIDVLLYFIMQMAMIFLGGNAILNGKMTIGDYTIIHSYLMMSINVVKYFYNLEKHIQNVLVSLDRINDIMNIPKENNGIIKENDIMSIKVNNLTFRYTDEVLINNLNVEFKKGKVYAIIGSNGIGKSTLLHILLGIYNSKIKGEILINNILIHDYDLIYLRMKAIGYLEQNPITISGSIIDNINLDKNLCIDEIISTINMSGIYVTENTNLYDDAEYLSGGEKIKLSLIRIFSKNASLLLLDEPSSMLDSSSIDLLLNYINIIKKDKIIIIVTHDDKIISISDEIIDLNNERSKNDYSM